MSKINIEEVGKEKGGPGWVGRKSFGGIKGELYEQREEEIKRVHKREIKGECD